MIKRVFDIIVALLALSVLAIPLLAVMLILKLTGEHKVWFLQERVGQDGRLFKVFKFATMRSDSEWTGNKDITLRNDPRVLPVGRVLRKGKINELPQVLNILLGDMSVVGWRPLMPKSFAYYPPHVQDKIVNLKPGLTGIGSIVFRDEEAITEAADKPPERVYQEDIAPYKGQLELWYQDHQSLWLDLKIIAATAWVILFPTSRPQDDWFDDLPPKPESLAALSAKRDHQRSADQMKPAVGAAIHHHE
jgi:lipopolysaccharide/colanic/teichoic acid biosynthesis glycosyltransferase